MTLEGKKWSGDYGGIGGETVESGFDRYAYRKLSNNKKNCVRRPLNWTSTQQC